MVSLFRIPQKGVVYRFWRWLSAFAIAVTLPIWLVSASVVLAQTTIARVQIHSLDASQFPDITVRAIFRYTNNVPVPLADMKPVAQLSENGRPISPEIQEIQSPVEVMFVADINALLMGQGATGRTSQDEMVQTLNALFDVLTVKGDTFGMVAADDIVNISVIRPLTADREAMKKSLDSIIRPLRDRGSDGALGVITAIRELQSSTNKTSPQSIVFISPSFYVENSIVRAIDQAQKAGIPVHTVYVRATDQGISNMVSFAGRTGGQFVWYRGADPLKPIKDWLIGQRSQFLLKYRSSGRETGDRTVELKVSGQAGLVSSQSYKVDLKSPQVVIESPPQRAEYLRDRKNASTDIDTIEPTSIPVSARISWPDKLPRRVVKAQMLMNNAQVGTTITNPAGDALPFTLDLKPFREPGVKELELKVVATDELGFEATSPPVTIVIKIPEYKVEVKPVAPCDEFSGVRKNACDLYLRYGGVVGWVALALTLLTMGVVAFRRKIVTVGGAAVTVFSEAMARLTKPPQAEIGAYIQAIKGGDMVSNRPIPLYLNTVTPVGRDRRQAEIVFDADVEQSVISRIHCEFREELGSYKIRDLGSTHGTFVNGVRLIEGGDGQVLLDGDQIEIGPLERGGVLLLFQLVAPLSEDSGAGAAAHSTFRPGK